MKPEYKTMSKPNGLPISKFGGPATYQIVVRGELEPYWSDRLAGLSISAITGPGGDKQTLLSGLIRDQSELNGVLETLYGLHLSIIRVEQVPDE